MQETWVLSLGWEDPWRREWQPTPVFLPGEFHGQMSLVGYSPWNHRVGHLHFSLGFSLGFHIMLLLLLSHFSCVLLCMTPSLGFSRQKNWSGLPFPSPMHKSEKWKWSRLVMSDSSRPHGLQPTRLLHPWDFPGKSTGVGCHCLLQSSRYSTLYLFVHVILTRCS